jgi:hypothetical protein
MTYVRVSARMTGTLLLLIVLATIQCTTVGAAGQKPISAAERKKIHDQQFSGLSGEIASRLARSQGDLVFDAYGTEDAPQYDSASALTEVWTCGSNAVVIGRPTAAFSEATEDGRTIYTTWNVLANDVLKAAAGRSVQPGNHIDVLMNGGSAKVGNRNVTVTHPYLPTLRPNRRYLFFLHLVEPTGAFKAGFVVDVTDEYLVNLRRGSYPDLEKLNTDELVTSLLSDVIPRALAAPLCAKEPVQ